MPAMVFLGLVVLVLMVQSFSKANPSKERSRSLPPTTTETSESPTRSPKGSQWAYTKQEDPMGKGSTMTATVVSSNTVDFSFPYNGPQHAELTLRSNPRQGKDVILTIQKGQLLVRSYEDSAVLVRFDDEPATRYSAVGPADHSSETVFIRNYPQFIQKTMKSKRVRISVNVFNEGAPVFDFDLTGFDLQKFIPKGAEPEETHKRKASKPGPDDETENVVIVQSHPFR